MATVIVVETPFNLGTEDHKILIDKGTKFHLDNRIWYNDIWAKTITSKGVRVRIGSNMISSEDMPKYIHYFKSKTKE